MRKPIDRPREKLGAIVYENQLSKNQINNIRQQSLALLSPNPWLAGAFLDGSTAAIVKHNYKQLPIRVRRQDHLDKGLHSTSGDAGRLGSSAK